MEATTGDPVLLFDAVLPDVNRLAYLEMAAAAVWAVEVDPEEVEEVES